MTQTFQFGWVSCPGFNSRPGSIQAVFELYFPICIRGNTCIYIGALVFVGCFIDHFDDKDQPDWGSNS